MGTTNRELEEQTWELLLEVMSQGERHQLNSEILTPYYTKLLIMFDTHDKQLHQALLSGLPGKETIYGSDVRDHESEGWNKCLDRTEQLINKVFNKEEKW